MGDDACMNLKAFSLAFMGMIPGFPRLFSAYGWFVLE